MLAGLGRVNVSTVSSPTSRAKLRAVALVAERDERGSTSVVALFGGGALSHSTWRAANMVFVTAVPVVLALIAFVSLARLQEVAAVEAIAKGGRDKPPDGVTAEESPRLGAPSSICSPSRVGGDYPSRWIWIVAVVFSFAVNANFTIAMPMSKEIALLSRGGIPLSGFVVGSWALGATLSLPTFVRLGCRHLRTSYLLHAALVCSGAFLETLVVFCFVRLHPLHGFSILPRWTVVLARLIQGFGGGVHYTCALAVTRACSDEQTRTRYYGYWFSASAAGVACGPLLSSLAELVTQYAVFVDQWHIALLAPRMLVCAYGAIALLVVWRYCPGDEEMLAWCGAAANLQRPLVLAGTRDADKERLSVVQARLGMALLLAAQFTRSLLRLTWGSGTLLLLQEHGLSRVRAGMHVAFVAAIFVLAQVGCSCIANWPRSLVGRAPGSNHQLVRCLEVLSAIGMLAMLRPALSTFLLGSSLFYAANALAGASIMSFCVGLGTEKKWLSVESMLLAHQLFWLVGFMLAPLYSRVVMSIGAVTRTVLVLTLAPIAACQVVVTEICMRGVRPAAQDDEQDRSLR